MNVLYLDCRMGVSGLKLLGALTELFENPDSFVYDFNRLGIEGVSMRRIPDAMNGITGSAVEIRRTASSKNDPYADEIDDDEDEVVQLKRTDRTLSDVEAFINSIELKESVKEKAIEVYRNIARAYAGANNKNPENMILKKTGSRDIIAAVIGVCYAIDRLAPSKIISGAVAVGSGYAHTSRGRLPIPTPEIELALGNVPYISGGEQGELCSLEGAALVAAFAEEFGDMPEMVNRRAGVGFGRRTFKNGTNCTKAAQGDCVKSAEEHMAEVCGEVFGISKTDIMMFASRMEELGAGQVYMNEVFDCNGNYGIHISCICKNELSNIITNELVKIDGIRFVRKVTANVYKA